MPHEIDIIAFFSLESTNMQNSRGYRSKAPQPHPKMNTRMMNKPEDDLTSLQTEALIANADHFETKPSYPVPL